MKNLQFLLLALTGILCACEITPFQPTISTCITLEEHPSWTEEAFKSGGEVDLRIQFPANYGGGGQQFLAEQLIFIKERNDGKVSMRYTYCNATDGCKLFGDPISHEFPNSLLLEDANNQPLPLDKFSTFCEEDELVGVMYYNDVREATGKMYMLHDSIFLEALDLTFDSTALEEVESILGTIQGY